MKRWVGFVISFGSGLLAGWSIAELIGGGDPLWTIGVIPLLAWLGIGCYAMWRMAHKHSTEKIEQ